MHPACHSKKQNHPQNCLLRRIQSWVRKTFSKPASLKRASLVTRDHSGNCVRQREIFPVLRVGDHSLYWSTEKQGRTQKVVQLNQVAIQGDCKWVRVASNPSELGTFIVNVHHDLWWCHATGEIGQVQVRKVVLDGNFFGGPDQPCSIPFKSIRFSFPRSNTNTGDTNRSRSRKLEHVGGRTEGLFLPACFFLRFEVQKRPFFVILFCSNFHSLEALEACLEACPDVFCSNFHGFATLEFKTCVASSYIFFGLLQFP